MIRTLTAIAMLFISLATATATIEAHSPDTVPDHGNSIIDLLRWDPTLHWSEAGDGMMVRTNDSYLALFMAAVEADIKAVSISIDIDNEIITFPCEIYDYPRYGRKHGYERRGRTAIVVIPEHSPFWNYIGAPVGYIFFGSLDGDFFPATDMYFYEPAVPIDNPNGFLHRYSADNDWKFWLETAGDHLGYHSDERII